MRGARQRWERPAVVIAAVTAAVWGTLALPASAAPPPTTVPIDDPFSFEDPGLTAACGFDEPVVVSGRDIGKLHIFTDDSGQVVKVLGVSRLAITIAANGKSVIFHEEAQALDVVQPDGTVITTVSGRLFGLDVIGHAVLDIATGEVFFQAGNRVDVARICAALTP